MFMKKHVKPIPKPSTANDKKIQALIQDLDSKEFATRMKATKDLEAIGEPARELLKKALEAKPALEVCQRLERLLDILKTRKELLDDYQYRVLQLIDYREFLDADMFQQEAAILAPLLRDLHGKDADSDSRFFKYSQTEFKNYIEELNKLKKIKK